MQSYHNHLCSANQKEEEAATRYFYLFQCKQRHAPLNELISYFEISTLVRETILQLELGHIDLVK